MQGKKKILNVMKIQCKEYQEEKRTVDLHVWLDHMGNV